MIYLALLRGINVGRNAKVEMSKLRETFESLGCKHVSTYINSGNVIFADARSPKELVPLIEQAITKDFNLEIRIVLRDLPAIQNLCTAVPLSWTNDTKQKTDVLFLWEEIDNPTIVEKVVINPPLERVQYIPGTLVWNVGRENVTKGAGLKLVKTSLYQHMTVRNINTVRTLEKLMTKAVSTATE
jgi:uncharacterized protein (DUF1697 family)